MVNKILNHYINFPLQIKVLLSYLLVFGIVIFIFNVMPFIIKRIVYYLILLLLYIQYGIMEIYYKLKKNFMKFNLINFDKFIVKLNNLKKFKEEKEKKRIKKRSIQFGLLLMCIYVLILFTYNKTNENYVIAVSKYIASFGESLNYYIEGGKFSIPEFVYPEKNDKETAKAIMNSTEEVEKSKDTEKKEETWSHYYVLNDATSYGNLRSEPTMENEKNIICSINKKHVLEYLEEEVADEMGRTWLHVRTKDGIEGWISSKILKQYDK